MKAALTTKFQTVPISAPPSPAIHHLLSKSWIQVAIPTFEIAPMAQMTWKRTRPVRKRQPVSRWSRYVNRLLRRKFQVMAPIVATICAVPNGASEVDSKAASMLR